MATDTKIVLKRSDVSTAVPNLEYLQFGELAFNYRDEKLYYRSYDVNGTTEIIKNYDFQRVVPVAKGGTGATTAVDARTNLEAAAIFSPAFLGTPSLAAAAVQPTISISTVDAAAQRALATVAYVRAEIADDAPTKTGGGASGTWGISVTGNAGTASKWATARSITSNNTSAGSDITFNVSLDGSANVTPTLAINTNRVSNIRTALSLVPGTHIQAYDADLAAIAALTGTSGFLKKTATDTWSLDTETYTPTSRTVTIDTGNGIIGGGAAQSLGANLSWTLGLTDTGVVANTYNDNATSVTPFTVDAKGRITGTGTPVLVTPAFSSITGKPTDLAGYGILDALNTSATGQTKAGSLTASSFIKTSGTSSQFLKADGSSDGTSYTPTARTLTLSTGNGITGGVTAADLSANRSWTFGLTGQALNLHNLATDGFFVRSTSGGTTSIVARSIAVGSGLSIANADGVSANPNISLATSNLTSLRDIATGGFLTRTAANTLTPRSIIVSGTGLSIANADGVSGNPTISSNATSSNSVSTIVSRDASGNFSAGAITGSSFVVSGTVNTTLVGSATGTAKTLTLPNTTDTVAVLADIPSHAGGADTTIPVADGRVLSAIVVNSLGHTTSVSSKTLAAADIPSLDTSKITTGTFEAARISDETVTGKVLTGLGGLFAGAEITSTDTILQAFRKLQGSVSAKANSASPTFTGTVTLPTGTSATAPLRFVSGTNLTSTVAGAVEFNGTNLFITNSALARKTIAFTDSNVSSATTATTATRLATARTISQGAASDINFSYTFDGSANVTPNLTINTSRASNIRSALGLEIGTNVQAYDPDLAAIAALADGPDAGTEIDTGFLRKTGENTWAIDPNIAPVPGEEVTIITGDVVGSSGIGDRNIVASLASVNTSPGTYNNSATAITQFTVDGKGRITSTGPSVTILPDWSSIANKPTTLSGYAIADAQALNNNLTSISAFTGTNNGLLRRNNDSSWTLDTTTYVPASRTLTITGAAGSGITATPNSATDLSANRTWSLSLEAGNLTQLRDLGTNTGIIAHNGTTGGGMVTRSIVPLDSNEITITNGNGVSGNPTISLTTSNLTSLRGITTGGFLTRTAANTLTPRSITIAAGSTGLSITNPDGVSGNPTLTLSSSSTNTTSSLVARDASGAFSAGAITGTNFRASQGIPNLTDSSTVGYAFGADGDTGLFSPIVGGGGTNGVVSLYSNNTERLRADSTGSHLYGTPTAPTATADTNTTQIATTAYVIGQAGSTTPTANGTAAVGTSAKYARADHVHPTDTTRAPLASPTFTGTPAAPTPTQTNNSTTIATTAYVRTAISSLIDSAPAALDTLNELAAALDDNANYASTITTALAGKEPTITAGTLGQYWRGDKSWQTLNSTAVGLGNVTNESKATMFTAPTFTNGTGTTPTSTTAAADTNTTQIATTAYVIGQAGSTTPTAAGTAAVGTSLRYARADHVHPADTTRAPLASPTFTGTITTPSILVGGSTIAVKAVGDAFTPTTGIYNEGAGFGHYKALVGVTNRDDNTGATVVLGKSRGTVIGSNTVVAINDTLGEIRFAGADGTDLQSVAASIIAAVNATPGNNNMPGRLVFSTTSDGASSPSERMRITSSGRVGIGNTNPSTPLDVTGAITASSDSFINGVRVGKGAGTNTESTVVGLSALSANTTGEDNSAFGKQALEYNTTGTRNAAFGAASAVFNTTGSDNVAIGAYSLVTNSTGNENIAIGSYAANATTGNDNIAIGSQSLITNTTGASNIAIGSDALRSNATASGNVGIGDSALRSNTTGSANTAIGTAALYANTTGISNTVIGWNAAPVNTTGERNTAVGRNTLNSNTTGSDNTAIGSNAIQSNTTGYSNIALGSAALLTNTTGYENVAIGLDALRSNTSGYHNVALGPNALRSNTSSGRNYWNIAIGANAMRYVNADFTWNNIAIGVDAIGNTTATYSQDNIAIGKSALSGNNVNGLGTSGCIAIGHWALQKAWNSSGTVAIGKNSCYNTYGGDNLIAIGEETLYSNTEGYDNVAIGRGTLWANTTGAENIAISRWALTNNTTGIRNTALGLTSLFSNTTGSENTAIGKDALYNNISGGSNIALGYQSSFGRKSGDWNIAIGSQSLLNDVNNNQNIAIGVLAGGNISTGVATVTITSGNSALTAGTYNNVVTTYVSGPTASSYPWLNITVGAGGTITAISVASPASGFTATGTVLSATIGVKTITVTVASLAYSGQNTIIGYSAGYNINNGSNNTIIGYNAGTDAVRNITNGSNNIVLGNNSSATAHIKIAWTVTSDKRDKTAFAPVSHGLEFVNALKPTAYRFKKDRDSDEPQEDSKTRYGFLAQDILELEGEQPVVIDNSDPEHLAYNESSLIPILVNAIKELSAELQSVKAELAILTK